MRSANTSNQQSSNISSSNAATTDSLLMQQQQQPFRSGAAAGASSSLMSSFSAIAAGNALGGGGGAPSVGAGGPGLNGSVLGSFGGRGAGLDGFTMDDFPALSTSASSNTNVGASNPASATAAAASAGSLSFAGLGGGGGGGAGGGGFLNSLQMNSNPMAARLAQSQQAAQTQQQQQQSLLAALAGGNTAAAAAALKRNGLPLSLAGGAGGPSTNLLGFGAGQQQPPPQLLGNYAKSVLTNPNAAGAGGTGGLQLAGGMLGSQTPPFTPGMLSQPTAAPPLQLGPIGPIGSSLANSSQSQQQQPSAASLDQQTAALAATLPSAGDRHGLLGLIDVIRMTDPDMSMLALGCDLTSLGLNLNSPDPLCPTLMSAFSVSPTHGADPYFNLPGCYRLPTTHVPPVLSKISSLSEESLFYAFYAITRDAVQEAAAQELYNRNWRFHKEMKMWITKEVVITLPNTNNNNESSSSSTTAAANGGATTPGSTTITATTTTTTTTVAPSFRAAVEANPAGNPPPTLERGVFIIFDPNQWQKVKRDGAIAYDMLEERVPINGPPPSSTSSALTNGISNSPPKSVEDSANLVNGVSPSPSAGTLSSITSSAAAGPASSSSTTTATATTSSVVTSKLPANVKPLSPSLHNSNPANQQQTQLSSFFSNVPGASSATSSSVLDEKLVRGMVGMGLMNTAGGPSDSSGYAPLALGRQQQLHQQQQQQSQAQSLLATLAGTGGAGGAGQTPAPGLMRLGNAAGAGADLSGSLGRSTGTQLWGSAATVSGGNASAFANQGFFGSGR